MTNKTRIQNIEKRVNNSGHIMFDTIAKIENWVFGIGKKEIITMQEWEEYKDHELKRGTLENELIALEEKIRNEDGFMELEFTLDPNL